MGLTTADVADQFDIEVLPDNLDSVALFTDVMTQWRMGPAGPIGLDYAALESVMRIRRIPRGEREQLLEDVRVMESAALDWIWSKK